MGSEWPTVRLGDHCLKVGSGATPRGGSSVYLEDGDVHLIRSQNVYNHGFNPNGIVSLSEDAAEKLRNVIVHENDVLLNITGDSVARACLAPAEFIPARVNQHVAIIRPNPRCFDSRYLRYLLVSPLMQSLLLTLAGAGATRNALTKNMIESLEITMPPVETQRAIAEKLSALDDKIELNRQTNQTLESMAQALFKSWFVDFDPVIDNALAAGNEIPESLAAKAAARRALQEQGTDKANQPHTLPDSIRQLFPSRFQFTEELGWIPEGWESAAVDRVISVNPRVSLKKGEIAKYVDMKALPVRGYGVDGVIQKAYSGGAKFEQGDVLLARITPCLENGKTGIVDFLNEGEVGFGSTEFIVLRPKRDLTTPFVACLARDNNFRSHCIQSMVGSSGRQRVQNSSFSDYFLALPADSKVLHLFNQIVKTPFESMTTNNNENSTLTALRDALLPKLLSGELRIPETDKKLDEALA